MTPALRNALLQLTEALRAERITLAEWRETVVTLLTEAVPTIDDAALAQTVATVRGTERAEDVVARLEALTTPENNGLAVAASVGLAAFLVQAALRPRSAETTRNAVPDTDSAPLDAFRSRFEQRVGQLAEALADGRITVQEWRVAFASELADMHIAAYVTGAGGVQLFDAEDFAALNAKIDEQLGYLNEWAAELEGGELPSVKALKARSNLYAGAANATLYEAQAQSVGVTLPFYPADRTLCHTNCGCMWEFHILPGAGNIDAYWRRALNDSCDTCLARERACSPLKIRNGQYQLAGFIGLVA